MIPPANYGHACELARPETPRPLGQGPRLPSARRAATKRRVSENEQTPNLWQRVCAPQKTHAARKWCLITCEAPRADLKCDTCAHCWPSPTGAHQGAKGL